MLAGYIATRVALNDGLSVKLDVIPKGAQTLGELAHGAGYRVYGICTNPNISPRVGYTRGFDEFVDLGYKATADQVIAAVEKRRERLAQGPWLLYLHFMDCHHPYRERAPWYDPAAKDERMSAYDSNLPYLDRRLATLFERLRLERNSLVFITADHGEEFRDHGRIGHSNQLYSELVRVPLVVHWQGVVAPRRIPDNVSSLDILPTLREVLGLPSDPTLGGRSLMPLLRGEREAPRALFPMRARESKNFIRKAVVFENWKYIVKVPHRADEPEELYDLTADPGEKNNLAETRPEVVHDMRERRARFEKTATVYPREYGEAFITPEMAEGLKALGYIE